MLPAHLQELLTAAVDGELNSAERRMVEKVLRDSRAAREFHARISSDATRLRRLPVVSPSDDLARSILNVIADRALTPTPLPMPRPQRFDVAKLVPWISIATAASVILMVSVSAYIFFAASQKQTAQQQAAALQKKESQATSSPRDLAKIDAPAKSDRVDEPKANGEPRDVAKVDPFPVEPETLPDPRVVGPDRIVATPSFPDNVPFKVVDVALPWILLPLHDLDQAYPSKTTRDELKKSEVARIDLFCKESSRGAETALAAFKARGHQLFIDAQAAERMKKRTKGDLVIYTESLTADEIAALLEQLGADDKRAERKKPDDGQFDKFMLAPFHPADLAELARLLGVPGNQIKLPKPKNTNPLDPRKPLENITASQLAQNLPKTTSRAAEKAVVILPYSPTFFPQSSKEIKAFLDKRGERKTGAVPMMLVLRTLP
jgi:hypothetical protein